MQNMADTHPVIAYRIILVTTSPWMVSAKADTQKSQNKTHIATVVLFDDTPPPSFVSSDDVSLLARIPGSPVALYASSVAKRYPCEVTNPALMSPLIWSAESFNLCAL